MPRWGKKEPESEEVTEEVAGSTLESQLAELQALRLSMEKAGVDSISKCDALMGALIAEIKKAE